VKVTQRGRDYLQATIILGILALILNVNPLLALGFTLSIIALICAAIIGSITTFNTRLIFEHPHLSGFKGDVMTTHVEIIVKRARWITVNLAKVEPPPGVEVSVKVVRENLVRLSVRTRYSGRFEGFLMHLEVRDILNLFSKKVQTLYSEFVLESFPSSLLASIPRSKPMPLTLGDRSTRSPGSSLELYALEQYQPFSETKNVLWKRVARMPDEQLIVRVRESSIPKTIRIGFILRVERFEEYALYTDEEERELARLRWRDLICEGLGSIGNNLLAVGCNLEIAHTSRKKMDVDLLKEQQAVKSSLGMKRDPSKIRQDVLDEGIEVSFVEDIPELSSALMQLWDLPWNGPNDEKLFDVVARSDLIVCGVRDLSNKIVANAVARKPALVISEEGAQPSVVGNQAIIFSGIEDIKRLVSMIIEK
jgi:hypothetical protein